ncbi:AsnC family protein [Kitasatospora sp. NPDC057936]|uniref:AsnC family protein n=1 Tax=Kitasatospora sp. NPDC057936 TaxID=3346283 RepID=UPI0036DEF309
MPLTAPPGGAEHRTDQAVLERLQQTPDLGPEALADSLGLRPAAVRLSVHRLTVSGQLPPSTPPDSR